MESRGKGRGSRGKKTRIKMMRKIKRKRGLRGSLRRSGGRGIESRKTIKRNKIKRINRIKRNTINSKKIKRKRNRIKRKKKIKGNRMQEKDDQEKQNQEEKRMKGNRKEEKDDQVNRIKRKKEDQWK